MSQSQPVSWQWPTAGPHSAWWLRRGWTEESFFIWMSYLNTRMSRIGNLRTGLTTNNQLLTIKYWFSKPTEIPKELTDLDLKVNQLQLYTLSYRSVICIVAYSCMTCIMIYAYPTMREIYCYSIKKNLPSIDTPIMGYVFEYCVNRPFRSFCHKKIQ